MTQNYYGAYSLSLTKPLSSYELDSHAKMAIDYITNLPFTAANKPVFYYFLEAWGTSVITDEIEGGFLQFACIIQSAIWHWGGQGTVNSDFIKGEADAYFRDRTQGTTFTSGVFSQNSVCDFYCTGGNPETCPTRANSVNSQWPGTIWADPQNVKFDVVPITQVIKDSTARHAIQTAIYSYYSDQVGQWKAYVAPCATCLPALTSFVVAANVNFATPTIVKAGTCGTAIRVTSGGSCTFIMYDNGAPINGGNGACYFTDTSLWGDAAFFGISNPTFEWVITSVNVDHTFVSHQCEYPKTKCKYWWGHYSVFCL